MYLVQSKQRLSRKPQVTIQKEEKLASRAKYLKFEEGSSTELSIFLDALRMKTKFTLI